jgi:hypothetical protein
MRAPHAGYLADPGTTRLTVERMWFEREPDLAAIQGDPATPAGLISAQFHLSDDASHVLNLALWTTEADYDAALESGPPGIAQTDTEAWQAVRTFDGIVRNVVTRYSARRSAP